MSPPSGKFKERFSVFSLFINLLHRLQKDERLCEPRPVRSPESNYEPVIRQRDALTTTLLDFRSQMNWTQNHINVVYNFHR